ncbi:MAG: thioredoxin domain-containing protein [Chloroflexota bacterium]
MTHEPNQPLTRRERRSLERRDRPIRDRSRAATRRPPRRPAWQSPFVLVSAAALVVAVAIIVLNQKPTTPVDTGGELFNPPMTYSTDIVDGDAMGLAGAPVVMEVWSDYQCPVCGRLVREQYPTLKSQFVDTGILRIQARDIAFLGGGERDESLELAAGAMCAARQDRYWTFHDYVFWNQGRENAGDYSATFVASVANRSGVSRSEWDACMESDDVRNEVRSATQQALGAGINATPTIALNGGTPVSGLPNAAQLIAQIQALAAGQTPAPVPTAVP